jgi:hypothetical protein
MRIEKFRHLFKTVTELRPIVSCHVSCVFLCNTRLNAEFAELDLGAGADSGTRIISGFSLFLSQNLAQCKFPEYTSVVRLLEISKNHWSGFLEYWRIIEPPVLNIRKKNNQNQITGSLGYFNNLKETVIFVKEAMKNKRFSDRIFFLSPKL